MEILTPKAELWVETNSVCHVAKCARLCYKSKAKTPQGDANLISWLQKHQHYSMFRHSSYYFKIDSDVFDSTFPNWMKNEINSFKTSNHPWVKIDSNIKGDVYIATNGQALMENSLFSSNYTDLWKCSVPFEVIQKEAPHLARYTIWVRTQISTTRELNRCSPNNIAEQSTRYVTQKGAIVRPHWISEEDADIWLSYDCDSYETKEFSYLSSCKRSFSEYTDLISSGVPKEDARGILPLDTATEAVYTYSWEEWQHILDLRLRGTTGKPHPNIVILAKLIEQALNSSKEI